MTARCRFRNDPPYPAARTTGSNRLALIRPSVFRTRSSISGCTHAVFDGCNWRRPASAPRSPLQHSLHRLVRRPTQRRRATIRPQRGVGVDNIHLVPRTLHPASPPPRAGLACTSSFARWGDASRLMASVGGDFHWRHVGTLAWRWTLEVEDVLLELAPEFLDGVEPGGVGGERDELDREVEALGSGAGVGGPGAGAEEREGRPLGLEGGEDVRVEVDWPVVEDHVEASARVGGGEVAVEADEGRDADLALLVRDGLAGVGIERPDDPGRGVAPGGALGAGVARCRPGRSPKPGRAGGSRSPRRDRGGLPRAAPPSRGLGSSPGGRASPGRRGSGLWIWSRPRCQRSLLSREHPPDPRQAGPGEARHRRPQRRQGPAGLVLPVLTRVARQHLQQPVRLLRPLATPAGGERVGLRPRPRPDRQRRQSLSLVPIQPPVHRVRRMRRSSPCSATHDAAVRSATCTSAAARSRAYGFGWCLTACSSVVRSTSLSSSRRVIPPSGRRRFLPFGWTHDFVNAERFNPARSTLAAWHTPRRGAGVRAFPSWSRSHAEGRRGLMAFDELLRHSPGCLRWAHQESPTPSPSPVREGGERCVCMLPSLAHGGGAGGRGLLSTQSDYHGKSSNAISPRPRWHVEWVQGTPHCCRFWTLTEAARMAALPGGARRGGRRRRPGAGRR